MKNLIENGKKLNNEIAIAQNMEDIKKIEDLLNTGYEWIRKGVPKLIAPIEESTERYSEKHTSIEDAAKALIATHVKLSASTGFITGLGGAITIPVTLPADLISVTWIQLRMVAGIAKLGGYDLNDDEVKAFIMACLTGQTVSSVLKDAGINVGEKVVLTGIKKIPGEAINRINQRVGFKLLTKFGEKGVINIGKIIPVVGGVVGGGFDAMTTLIIARNAYKLFIGNSVASNNDIIGDFTLEDIEDIAEVA